MKHHTDKDNSERCDKVENRIGSIERDNEIWKVILEYYNEINNKTEDKLEEDRTNKQNVSYWCREEENDKHLFSNPKQRIMARFIRSYLNTQYHPNQYEDLFDKQDVIKTIHGFLNSDIIFSDEKEEENYKKLKLFAKEALALMDGLKLEEYPFEQLQTANFSALSAHVNSKFNEINNKKNKNLPEYQKLSKYEKIIIEKLDEPYQTIMKMQKLLPGYGVALTCDFLKETHLCNIAKPDVHLCHVFSVIDKNRYSLDLALAKRIAEFAEHVSPPDSNDFCNTGSFYVDKIIWMLCSKSKSIKENLMKRIAEL